VVVSVVEEEEGAMHAAPADRPAAGAGARVHFEQRRHGLRGDPNGRQTAFVIGDWPMRSNADVIVMGNRASARAGEESTRLAGDHSWAPCSVLVVP